MKQNTLRVLFFVLKSRLLKNGEAPIILRVTIDGRQDEVRIQRSVPLKLWDNVKERSKGKDRSSTELNSYIEALKVRLYQIHKELLCREALITPKNLLIKLFSKEERHLVLQTMRNCIDDWTSLIGTVYHPSTISRYYN
ncbi:Arm DNA-binding domain-containing protein, partial [Phocaeicola plebeius]|uniref:Arm DNA-binding domain-containing protein n=1 Tax=Phocaeicola plebeius TaxID=310297 RepID=UPI003FD7BEE6